LRAPDRGARGPDRCHRGTERPGDGHAAAPAAAALHGGSRGEDGVHALRGDAEAHDAAGVAEVALLDEAPAVLDHGVAGGPHGGPADVAAAVAEVDPRRGPLVAGDPHPAELVVIDPAAVVVRRPAPLVVVLALEDPAAVLVGGPGAVGRVG